MTNFGKILFRYRTWIAVPFFILLVLFSRPVAYPVIAYSFISAGIAIRMWAAGYIGASARGTSFATSLRVINGPYRLLRHPLYLGNFFLVIGVIMLFNPPFLYAVILITAFIIMYGLIIVSEQAYIRQLPKKKARFKCKNCLGELSTVSVLIVIVLIHLIVDKLL